MQPQRQSVWDRVERPAPDNPSGEEPMEIDCNREHDYCAVPEPASLDMALNEICNLKEKLETLQIENEELKIQSTFGLQRFAGSDDDIRFYTRFASYSHFMKFWRLIEPSVHKMVCSTRARAAEKGSEAVTAFRASHTRYSLQPIDELFLFQMYLAAGLRERDLANRFKIHPSTVSRIISSWTNYLYTLLGSLCIWI